MVDCDKGEDGAKYRTAQLEPDLAFQMLAMHRQDAHGNGQGELVGQRQQEQHAAPAAVSKV